MSNETQDIQARLTADLKTAMKAKDKLRVDVIRMMRAALQSAEQAAAKDQYDTAVREIEARHSEDASAREAALAGLTAEPVPLTDEQQQAVIRREVKRRREAADSYQQAGQTDRAAQEEAEAAILADYLPRQLGEDELRPQVAALIAEHGLSGASAMGKLMPLLMTRFQGRADGKLLSRLARELLA